ncbi:MAG TPA: hypoxanthine phosphoribosyltransferase [Anaeromyxobacteraceae bacterium]|nr:hypoxanthine phosphoribosyltransferase [Anaeromyxobacteraceae bacterium]
MRDLEPLITEERLRARVAELGAEITRDYAGQTLVVVAVLKGSFVFVADLVRAVRLPLEVEFIGISSYAGTSSSGIVQITQDLSRPVAGEHVLLVEDIVDSGLTMSYLLDNLSIRRPASVQVCALLEKPTRAKVKVPIAYKGFVIPDRFVVGYGLDVDGRYRNLPYLGVYEPPPGDSAG